MSALGSLTPDQIKQAIALNNQRTGRQTPYQQNDNPGAMMPGQDMPASAQPGPGGPAGVAGILPPVMPNALAPQQPAGIDGDGGAPAAAAQLKQPAQGATFNAIGPGYTEGIGINGQLIRTPTQAGDQNLQTAMQPVGAGPAAPQAAAGQSGAPGDPLAGYRQFMQATANGPYQQFNPDFQKQALANYGALDNINTGNAKLDLEKAAEARNLLMTQGQLGHMTTDDAIKQQLANLSVRQYDEGKSGASDSAWIADLMSKNPNLNEAQARSALAIKNAVAPRPASQPQQPIGLAGAAGPQLPSGVAAAAPPVMTPTSEIAAAAESMRPGAGTALTAALGDAGQDYQRAFRSIHDTLGEQGIQSHQQAVRALLNKMAGGTDEDMRNSLRPSMPVRGLQWLGNLLESGPVTGRTAANSLSHVFGGDTRASDLLQRLYGL